MRSELIVSAKGQITLPKEMREELGLRPGDAVVWTVIDGAVLITAKSVDFNDLLGYFGEKARTSTELEVIDRTVAKAAGRQALPPVGDEKADAA
jgi:AbrB family looped-hinge helix DNA binding protein